LDKKQGTSPAIKERFVAPLYLCVSTVKYQSLYKTYDFNSQMTRTSTPASPAQHHLFQLSTPRRSASLLFDSSALSQNRYVVFTNSDF